MARWACPVVARLNISDMLPFVHRACQISPVQHSQFLLNWVQDSEMSLYWVYNSRCHGRYHETRLQSAPWENFLEVLGWKDAQGRTNFSLKNCVRIYSNKAEAVGLGGELTLWENLLACLWQRVWKASTWFSLNHLPSGHHASKSLFWLL